MPAQLSDLEITRLIDERKVLPADYQRKIQSKPKPGHREGELAIVGDDGDEFRLLVRQSLTNQLDFSVILGYLPPQSNQLFRLRRYNGKSHEHSNKLEGQTFYDFHVHTATERYQVVGLREDSFAEPTVRFTDLASAVNCMLTECGFAVSPGTQSSLF